MPFELTVPCRDSLGRPGTTVVKLDEDQRRVTLAVPVPAASLDWREADETIAALQAARELLPGGRQ